MLQTPCLWTHFSTLTSYLFILTKLVNQFYPQEKLFLFAQNGESIEMFSNISHLTFDIILRCVFSYESDVQRKGLNFIFKLFG